LRTIGCAALPQGSIAMTRSLRRDALFLAAALISSSLAFSPSKLHRAATILIERTSATSTAFARRHAQAGWTSRLHRRPHTNLQATIEATKPAINTTDTATKLADPINDTTSISALLATPSIQKGTIELLEREEKLKEQMEAQASAIASEILDENCEIDPFTSAPIDDLCIDEVKKEGFRSDLTADIKQIGSLVGGRGGEVAEMMEQAETVATLDTAKKAVSGDALEKGCTFHWLLLFV
jgi:hypothetical protein